SSSLYTLATDLAIRVAQFILCSHVNMLIDVRTRVFKAKVFPPALWAMLFTMATMIIGGGVHTRVRWTPPLLHAGLAAASLYFNVVAFWKEAKYMIENNMLMEEVDRLLR